MKLRSLKPRMYNAIFHTHTVSGIVISFALYIIFFCGAVSLFMNELYRWENPEARFESVSADQINYDKIISSVPGQIKGFDSSAQFGLAPPTDANPYVLFYGSKKDDKGNTERFSTYVNPITLNMMPANLPKTHMAHTIYELHYFNQIPLAGGYLAGLVSFFFLFAIITGLLTHWKNIVNKFYGLTAKGKWKQVWTNSHISLGFIALPFQLIYAVTGALLCLSIALLAPTALLLFNGDTTQILKAVNPDAGYQYDAASQTLETHATFNTIYQKTKQANPNATVTYLYSSNYHKADGTITARTDNLRGLAGDGLYIYSAKDGRLIQSVHPDDKTYSAGAFGVLIKLHYANFGGAFIKIIYFILAMITCYVITSGVLIWQSARDNARYTDQQRKFHHRVTQVYLAITLALFPALAIIFLANISVPMQLPNRAELVNTIFFTGWLVLSLIGLFWNSYKLQFRNYMFTGSTLALLIPIANGSFTGDWIWKTLLSQQVYVYTVDITWFIAGIFGIWISLQAKLKPAS